MPLAAFVAPGVAGVYRVFGRAGYVATGLAAVALTAGTITRNRLLQDEVALWADTIGRVPSNPRAHASLGLALLDRGLAAEAIPHFQSALTLDPRAVATEKTWATPISNSGGWPRRRRALSWSGCARWRLEIRCGRGALTPRPGACALAFPRGEGTPPTRTFRPLPPGHFFAGTTLLPAGRADCHATIRHVPFSFRQTAR